MTAPVGWLAGRPSTCQLGLVPSKFGARPVISSVRNFIIFRGCLQVSAPVCACIYGLPVTWVLPRSLRLWLPETGRPRLPPCLSTSSPARTGGSSYNRAWLSMKSVASRVRSPPLPWPGCSSSCPFLQGFQLLQGPEQPYAMMLSALPGHNLKCCD